MCLLKRRGLVKLMGLVKLTVFVFIFLSSVFSLNVYATNGFELFADDNLIKPDEPFVVKFESSVKETSASFYVRPKVSNGNVFIYDDSTQKWLPSNLATTNYPKVKNSVLLKIQGLDKVKTFLTLSLINTLSGVSIDSYPLGLWVGDFNTTYLSGITGGVNTLFYDKPDKSSNIKSDYISTLNMAITTAPNSGPLFSGKNIPLYVILLMSCIVFCIQGVMCISFSMIKYSNDAKNQDLQMVARDNNDGDNFPRLRDSWENNSTNGV